MGDKQLVIISGSLQTNSWNLSPAGWQQNESFNLAGWSLLSSGKADLRLFLTAILRQCQCQSQSQCQHHWQSAHPRLSFKTDASTTLLVDLALITFIQATCHSSTRGSESAHILRAC